MLMDEIDVSVDFNGIVIFGYPDINNFFECPVESGKNILREFTQTDLGDRIVDAGVVIPIINIDDGGYWVRFFDGSPEASPRRNVVFSDNGYVLKVNSDLYIADAAVFWDWEEYLGWKKVNIAPGFYSATVEGVRHLDELGKIARIGYDVILKKTDSLEKRTAKIREDSRVC